MPLYQYKAKKGPTEVVQGEIDAENEDAALGKISALGLIPVKLHLAGTENGRRGGFETRPYTSSESQPAASSEPTAPSTGIRNTRISYKDLNVFTRQFAILLKASVPLLKIFDVLQIQTQNKKFREVLTQIQAMIREGSSLSEVLARYPRIFSQIYVNMVNAGEVSGTLEKILMRLAQFSEQEAEIRSRIKSALIYPLFLFTMGILTIFILLTFVMPRLLSLFSDLGTELPTPTQWLIKISAFCQHYWIPMAGAIGFIVVALRTWGLPEPQKRILDTMAMKTPILKGIIEKAEISRFLRSMELLYEHGIALYRAVEIAAKTVSNLAIREALQKVPERLEGGQTLAKSLEDVPYISIFVSQMISIGEESGQLTSAIQETASFYEQETNQVIKIATTLIEPIMILGVGSIVGFIVISMLLPIFDIHVLAQ